MWYDYSGDEVEKTVTEREYDAKGNMVKETVTVTRTKKSRPNYPYQYPYQVTY